MLYKIFSFIRKFLLFLFQWCHSCISMPIIVSRLFPRIFSILSAILYNPQFYHTYVRWKSSILSENVSSSFFNRILIVFVCPSLYLSFLFQKNLVLKIILCYPQFYHTYVRWKILFYRKIFPLHLSIISELYLYAYHCIWDFSKKIFNFISYPK